MTTPAPDQGVLERAREIVKRATFGYGGSMDDEPNHDAIDPGRIRELIAAALTAAASEARAAERERWMPMIRAALGVAFADNDEVLAVSRVAIGAAMKDLDDYCKAALATPPQSARPHDFQGGPVCAVCGQRYSATSPTWCPGQTEESE